MTNDPPALLAPVYGRMLEDFEVGAVYDHPWRVTLDVGMLGLVQASFLDATPTYSARPYALAAGFVDRPAPPLWLLNLALSFSVHDVSEQAIAHLAYLDVRFPAPAYVGETVRARSVVLGVQRSGVATEGAPARGVVHVGTYLTCEGDDGEKIVCAFERKALVRGGGPLAARPRASIDEGRLAPAPSLPLPMPASPICLRAPEGLAGTFPYFFEDLREGVVIAHPLGKTIAESEHMQLTALCRNTHPLHFDEHYARSGGSFLGTRVVYGGLVLGWTAALASRELSGNAVWDLGFDEGAHPAPVVAGDTLYAASKILAARELGGGLGELRVRMVGLKNVRPEEAITRHPHLFEAELGKKDPSTKVPEKVVEITRILVVRTRA